MILILFLGNTGQKYILNRHNIGFIFAEKLANQLNLNFNLNKKFNVFLCETNQEDFISLVTPDIFNSFSKLSNNHNKILNNEKTNFQNKKIILVKPNCYMNESGNVVLPIKMKYNPEKIVVIHDELDLPLGEIRHKLGGGDNGHNGLKSITQKIGNQYWRIRFGIGRPKLHQFNEKIASINVADYVLSNFTQDEQKIIDSSIDTIIENIIKIILVN